MPHTVDKASKRGGDRPGSWNWTEAEASPGRRTPSGSGWRSAGQTTARACTRPAYPAKTGNCLWGRCFRSRAGWFCAGPSPWTRCAVRAAGPSPAAGVRWPSRFRRARRTPVRRPSGACAGTVRSCWPTPFYAAARGSGAAFSGVPRGRGFCWPRRWSATGRFLCRRCSAWGGWRMCRDGPMWSGGSTGRETRSCRTEEVL